jgi:hypothetical protein
MASLDERVDKLEQQMAKIIDKLEGGGSGEAAEALATGHADTETAIADLAAQLDALQLEAVTYGAKVALRMHSEKVIMPMPDGGPTDERQPVAFESRTDPGPWESFTLERGSD